MAEVEGRWFDGRHSRPTPVSVRLVPGPRGPALELQPTGAGTGEPLRLANQQVGWPEAWSSRRAPARVVLDLGPHGSLEIDDPLRWQALLQSAGQRPSLAQRMQTRWPVFLGVLLVAAAALFSFYRWGTPWAATRITALVPLQWETELSARALADLDARLLKPSKLPADRQAALQARFAQLKAQADPSLQRYPGYAPVLSLAFRHGLGANAFALPGGTIVMTDGLVEAAAKEKIGDEALAGVLAHEIGHVVHRHTTRMVVEQGVLNIGLGLALGDASSLLSFGSSLLTGLAYRRGHETEADCHAAALMRKAGLPAAPMADLLLALEGQRGGKAAAGAGAEESASGWGELLASHPHSAERARRLKAGQSEGC
ncbi:MAG TPA: M48 family metallopeptidase [Ramlibacter sp.]|nr:M48 family metallopeptidase [Ramlibacter sp.]